jgi:hypothetical protein
MPTTPDSYANMSTDDIRGVLEERVGALIGKFGQAADAGQTGEAPAGGSPEGSPPVPPELEEPASVSGSSAEEALGGILASGVSDPAEVVSALRDRGFEISKSTPTGEGAESTPAEAMAGGELPEEPDDEGAPPMIKARRAAAKKAAEKSTKKEETA